MQEDPRTKQVGILMAVVYTEIRQKIDVRPALGAVLHSTSEDFVLESLPHVLAGLFTAISGRWQIPRFLRWGEDVGGPLHST